MTIRGLGGLALAMVIAACGPSAPGAAGEEDTALQAAQAATADVTPVTVAEAFHTARDTMLNIDSPAVWHGPEGEHWLFSTAKYGNVIRVEDAATGELLRDVGGAGDGAGELRRPNGIAVIDDLMIVVERDNARVQVFTLPDFRSIGTFGEPELRLPYGIAAYRERTGAYAAYITDNYELVEDEVPPDSLLGERVRHYRLTVADGRAEAEQLHVFGDTSGPGRLKVVESIAVDAPNDRLMIAEELEGESMIKVYSLDGRFTGEVIDSAFFPHQAEGIVLYDCGADGGYWITTDQGEDINTFHVFDRQTLDHVGSFRGPTVLNTDGIAITQRAFPGFPAGAFYAVHNDGNIAAFSWQAIADSLRADCGR